MEQFVVSTKPESCTGTSKRLCLAGAGLANPFQCGQSVNYGQLCVPHRTITEKKCKESGRN